MVEVKALLEIGKFVAQERIKEILSQRISKRKLLALIKKQKHNSFEMGDVMRLIFVEYVQGNLNGDEK